MVKTKTMYLFHTPKFISISILYNYVYIHNIDIIAKETRPFK